MKVLNDVEIGMLLEKILCGEMEIAYAREANNGFTYMSVRKRRPVLRDHVNPVQEREPTI